MRWFNDLPITYKLLASVSLAALLTLVLSLFSFQRLNDAHRQIGAIAGEDIPKVQALGDIRGYLGELRTYELALVSTQNFGEYEPRFAAMDTAIAGAREQYASHLDPDADRTRYESMRGAIDGYLAASARLLDAARAGDYEAAAAISSDESRPQRRVTFAAIDALTAADREHLDADLAASEAAFVQSRNALVVLTLAAVGIALGAGFFISRRIGVALGEATAVSRAIAEGRFDSRIEATSRDETGRLLESM
ncbi:MCP four helix bundle domain-containing protein [Coralloluteibacterium stylophorae]|uniref:Methyl-accepting chemotaxis protein n=1 Tax=Coralloluteibacterium stylophorae TaxID=1776034 RepID=A0A8J7VYW9_9GAMM|nr:methyl-accepting chemotaxis protein [Coralloluteibacterium stylophorae]MBS7457254.1 methyl-accepting chemotaxis protein [Coralloluteibacterium stylophorae]